jgi:hypothetical protein
VLSLDRPAAAGGPGAKGRDDVGVKIPDDQLGLGRRHASDDITPGCPHPQWGDAPIDCGLHYLKARFPAAWRNARGIRAAPALTLLSSPS